MSISIPNNMLSVEKLLTIVNSISDGVLAVDREMRITFFNKAAESITGSHKDDVIGRQCWEVFRTNVCDNDCPLHQTFRTGEPVINKYVCSTHSDGRQIPISVSTALLRDENGSIFGGVETFRDLTQVEALRKILESNYTFSDIIGRSKPMQDLFTLLPTLAQSESTVLIEGESGTGKELVAKAIHQLSSRKKKPMVTVNCGAIPDSLLESELFGYKAGAFTDAKKDKLGRFAIAEGGTIFLDEIGDVSAALQVKLLRILQDHIYEPLGSIRSEKADVRVIAATNKNLTEMMKEEQFRQDLYYRLNVVGVKVAPLRERISDIPLLFDHFIGKFNHLRNKDISGVTPSSMNILMNYAYPGNVRELENIIEHAFVLCPSGVIMPEHLPVYLKRDTQPIPLIEVNGSLEQVEILTITAALKRNNWRRNDTATELGINPSTLYRKMQRYKLILKNE
ncbi:MAG: sigma 54-interacting transcriptional regulator [Candidatus Electryonea clarkiae]|nr:sigma 54-interacting transcriptional regulator [Candidatus Electryonea clarkiae]